MRINLFFDGFLNGNISPHTYQHFVIVATYFYYTCIRSKFHHLSVSFSPVSSATVLKHIQYIVGCRLFILWVYNQYNQVIYKQIKILMKVISLSAFTFLMVDWLILRLNSLWFYFISFSEISKKCRSVSSLLTLFFQMINIFFASVVLESIILWLIFVFLFVSGCNNIGNIF